MSRDRFPPDAIFHKRSGLRDGSFSHAQRKAQFPPKNFIVFLYKLPNNFSCISTKITLYCNCSKKVLKNSTNAAKCSLIDRLSLFFPFFFTLFFFVIGSHLPITAKQARFYPSLFCFCLNFFREANFLCTDLLVHLNRTGGSPYPGREFFAEPQRGIALCRARETAASAAGTKRKGHLRFPFLFELLPFPYLLARRKSESGDRFENGVRQSGYSCVSFATYSQFTDSVLLHMWFTLRRRNITVLRNSFVWILCVAPTNCTRYAVECDKVNCPKGKRRCPGVRPGAPYQTICRQPIVGAASGRPHNTTPSHSLHSTSLFYAKKNPKPRLRVLCVSALTS